MAKGKTLYLLFVVLIAISSTVKAHSVSGYLFDDISLKPIPFANIVIYGTSQGTISDIDGFFRLQTTKLPVDLYIKVIGYRDTIVRVYSFVHLKIPLKEKTYQLNEAVILPVVPIAKWCLDPVWATFNMKFYFPTVRLRWSLRATIFK